VIRALLRGEEVSHDGLVHVDRARVWTRPDELPPLLGAAVSVATARWCARWADGLITVNQPVATLRELVDAYRDVGGRGRLHLQVHLSWAPDEAAAEAIAHDQWRTNVLPPPACWDIDSPTVFDAATAHVRPDAVRKTVQVGSDLGWHTAQLAQRIELGFDELALHHVGQEQDAFVDTFGAKVLPQLRSAA
jgi:alkanesulfonate monooxygenase SsuD/methylene tetrahydromethanopterin reductase-like flavin-dependent oxidoreductase (luciferase family)